MSENVDHGKEVAEKPPLYRDLTRSTPLREGAVRKSDDVTRRVLKKTRSEDAVSTLKEGIAELSRDTHAKFPNYPDERLSMLLDTTFGFGRLKKDTLLHAGQTKDMYEKDHSARLQHALTHYILSASESDNPDYVSTMYSLTRNLARLSRGLSEIEGADVRGVWQGMRNELAIVKVLQDNGYRVVLPDYEQDTAEVNDSDNEVMQLDVKNGIDLIAVSPEGRMLLIDAKGRKSNKDIASAVQSGRPEKVDTSRGMNPLVAETIVKVAQMCGGDMGDTYRMKVVLPTEGRSFVGSDFLTDLHTDPEAQRQSLDKFGKVKPEIAEMIMQQVGVRQDNRDLVSA